ncbi:MAG: histidinol-phosphate transaminase [Kiritimatiellia bacterium]|nr:histidinol-phosphate transaminase [Kiritimatiellia bacterium]MDP7023626.1 histidinol-phosphate transaminase [Kiritimatiellia bacterium]
MKSFAELANPWVQDLVVYEPGRPIEEVARELGFTNPGDIIKLASNENALGPSPLAVQAMRGAAETMHLYPDGGTFTLRQALAAHLDVDPAQILPGTGSNELIELLGHAFLGEGTNIVMSRQAFVVYRLVANAARAATIAVPMTDFRHDLMAMLDAITPETKIVFIANPNNPTGTMVSQAEIDRFMDAVPNDVIVCFDEAYVELLDPGQQPDVLQYVRAGRNVVVLRTFSKAYGLAGLRMGYAVAPEPCSALLNSVRQPFNVNAMAQVAARAALADEDHIERTRRLVSDGIAQFEAGFKALGLAWVPTVVNFVLVEVGAGRETFVALQKEGVITRPMDGYGLPGHIRITIGTREENEKCLLALARVMEDSK